MASSINLAIPSIGKQFGAGAFQLGWVVTGYLLTSAAFLLPFGKLADIIGRRRVFITGITPFFYSFFDLRIFPDYRNANRSPITPGRCCRHDFWNQHCYFNICFPCQ
ncbi:MAG: MFS transporter [Bacillota bacterium]